MRMLFIPNSMPNIHQSRPIGSGGSNTEHNLCFVNKDRFEECRFETKVGPPSDGLNDGEDIKEGEKELNGV